MDNYESLPQVVPPPSALKQRHWDFIKKRAREIVQGFEIEYCKACVIAYFEFFSGNEEEMH